MGHCLLYYICQYCPTQTYCHIYLLIWPLRLPHQESPVGHCRGSHHSNCVWGTFGCWVVVVGFHLHSCARNLCLVVDGRGGGREYCTISFGHLYRNPSQCALLFDRVAVLTGLPLAGFLCSLRHDCLAFFPHCWVSRSTQMAPHTWSEKNKRIITKLNSAPN